MRVLFLLFLLVSSTYAAQPIKYQTSQQLEITATTTSTSIIGQNLSRGYLLIVNKGTQDVFVKARTEHSSTEGVRIIPGGNWEPFVVPVDEMFIKSSSGSQSVSVIEGQ